MMTFRFLQAASRRTMVVGNSNSWLSHIQYSHGGYYNVIATTKRLITSRAARALLGLPTHQSSRPAPPPLTLQELRHAYFAAAKKCHPDTKHSNDDDNDDDGNNSRDNDDSTTNATATDFLQITRAYELLQGEITQNQDLLLSTITTDEEEEFRQACQASLGIPAEIVEECKQNPIFRKWLSGRTDAAAYWRTFFLQHGGLAPKLRPSGGHITSGTNKNSAPPHTTRRRRKK